MVEVVATADIPNGSDSATGTTVLDPKSLPQASLNC